MESAGVLSDDEIIQIMKSGYRAGINRVHWTGGEPTLRDMERIIGKSRELGYVDQILTTNGSRGGEYVKKMAKQGLNRLIVSLDTMNPQRFKNITKRDCLDKVIETIRTSVEVLEQSTKMNIVYLEETKTEIFDFITLSQEINTNKNNLGNLVIKFIEMTEMNPRFFAPDGKQFYNQHHTGKELMLMELRKFGTLIPTDVIGNNPNTHYWFIPEIRLKVGMINIPSQNYMCGGDGCAKIRLNPYGKIAVCVNQEPVDINNKTEQEQAEIIKNLINYRGLIDSFYPQRKHQQRDNFGYWRFGNCNDANSK